MLNPLFSQHAGNRKQRGFWQTLKRMLTLGFPVLFFFLAVWLVFVRFQKSPLAEIEDLLAEKKWQAADRKIRAILPEEKMARLKLLYFGSIASAGMLMNGKSEDSAIPYDRMLRKEDSTGIFFRESLVRRMEIFTDSPAFGGFLCDMVSGFPDAGKDRSLLKVAEAGFHRKNSWQALPDGCFNNLSSGIFRDSTRSIAGTNVNMRTNGDLNAPVIAKLASETRVLIRMKGDEMEYLGKRESWYYILTENGEQGWIFGSFLKSRL